MREVDEHKIIRNILNGDVQAFEEIVTLYQDMVYTLSYRVLKNREEAEELAQDVFVKVFQSLNNFNMKSKLSTWIYRITYNSSINKYKSNSKQLVTTEIDYKTEYKFNIEPDALFNMSSNEKREIIINSLLKLRETERIIVTLYYYEELPIAEIADIVGISAQNVKIKLYRSRQKLHTELIGKIDKETINYEYS